MKKTRYLLYLFSFLLITILSTNINVYATDVSILTCKYRGILYALCGDSAGDECTVDVTISLIKNSFRLTSANLVNDFYTIDECKSGKDLSTCMRAVYGRDYSFSYVSAIKQASNGYYSKITDSNEYRTYFVKDGYWTCPTSIAVLPRQNDPYTIGAFVSSESFNKSYCESSKIDDFSCNAMSDQPILELYETVHQTQDLGQNITSQTSSGSCCVYKHGITKLYTYSANSAGGATNYAVCIGDNCMTSDPNTVNNAQYINTSDGFESYHNMSNCSNMPEHIWYSGTGSLGSNERVYNFYSSNPGNIGSTVFTATLDPNEYCESTVNNFANGSNNNIDFGNQVEVNCEGIIGQEMIDFLNKIFRWIQILAPIFVIIMGGIDFASAVLQDDKDAMKKASSKFIKRLIIAVALFFIPLILSWLLNIFNDISGAASSTCGIGE